MTRTRVSWSNSVDLITGPCIVCGKEVRFLIPDDRPDPALLYHATCDMMPAVREHLKSAHPPPLPAEYVIVKKAPAAAAPAPAAAPATPPPSPATPTA